MYLVVIAWLYVVLMAAVAEAVSSTGTVLGAVITFLLYGLLPLGIVVYIIRTPGRKRALHLRALAEREEALQRQSPTAAQDVPGTAAVPSAPATTSTLTLASAEPDAGRKTPAATEPGTVAPVRKEA